MAKLLLYFNCATLFSFSFLSLTSCLRYGDTSRTLHFPQKKDHQLPTTINSLSLGETTQEGSLNSPMRSKRSSVLLESSNKIITTFPLNNSHEQLSVHWAGKGSKIVICLARNRQQKEGDTSKTFFSYDYGETFTERQKERMRLSVAKESVISMFYISPVVISHYIFTDVIHNYIFTTEDYGKTFNSLLVPFKPDIISWHPNDANILLGMEKDDSQKRLWLSEDLGVTWIAIAESVKTFFWGEKNIDPDVTLFVQRQEPGRSTSTILSSTNFFRNEEVKNVLLSDVEDFEVREKYLFATKRQVVQGSKNAHNGTLQLWVSYNRKQFHAATFPIPLDKMDFYIADASEDQVFACVMHSPQVTNLYISNQEGTEFELSLPSILYFSPAGAGKDLWNSDEPIVDLHKVEGVRGVYIATQLRDENLESDKGDLGGRLFSLITFNKGGDWNPLEPPKMDSKGQPIECSKALNCSLHLTQKFSQFYPGSRTPPILSRASAVGIIVASGVVGKSLKGHPSCFVSSDAGLTWHQVLYGNYVFAMGDHGGLIVAAEYYKQGGETSHIMYSMNEGENWISQQILTDEPGNKLRIYGLMTEPGEKTTVFTLFGSRPEHHQWLLVKVDLRSLFAKPCKANDYKHWSPHGYGKSCLLGRKDVYERRLSHIACYNGNDYIRPVFTENCPCEREDFECDFGFKENSNIKICARDMSSNYNPYMVPHPCHEGSFYNRTKGYRLVSGDSCTEGELEKFNPETIPCPIKDESEFLLFAQRQQISRISLNGDDSTETGDHGWEKLPLDNLKNVIAIDFDILNKCLFWADIDEDKIMRFCLGNNAKNEKNNGEKNFDLEPEILVETGLASVEGLAFDWIARNLYFVDGELAKVEVIQTDMHNFGRMRRTILNHTLVEKPRGIALHPIKGYLFLTDWSESKPCLIRSGLDGTSYTILFDSSTVSWPNGVTIDFLGEKIYWADAKRDYIASANFDGQNLVYVLQGSGIVPHPFAVGIYKDWLYFDDWNRRQIVMANKYDGKGLKVLARNIVGSMDMKVYSYGIMQGTNICANRTLAGCTHLCMVKPGNQHICLCPDGMVVKKLSDGSENCSCPHGEIIHDNGTCASLSSTCGAEQFSCSHLICIPALWKCDGDDDCGDKSDEAECGIHSCDSNQFQCKNGQCIPTAWHCDIDKDCGDNSDELDCSYPACAVDQFHCNNGRCIDTKYVCDFDDDCRDGSDELNCTRSHSASCNSDEFSCQLSNGHPLCLPLTFACDGEKDCPDGKDEENCGTSTCEPWKMKCTNGRCIFATWKCDGENDCHDGSDEINCTATTSTATSLIPTKTKSPGNCSSWMFTCTNSNCVPFGWRCDGADDCGDSSDEIMCDGSKDNFTTSKISPNFTTSPTIADSNCGENRFKCNTGKCIWNSWICDGSKDCHDGEDENNCDTVSLRCGPGHFRCVHSSGCIPAEDICNGRSDCGDGSDEWSCSTQPVPKTVTCSTNEFTCQTGECIAYSEYCDQHKDCIDGSDEIHCDGKGFHVKRLEVDLKSLKSTSFNVSWSSPIEKSFKFEYMLSYSEIDMRQMVWMNSTWTPFTSQKLSNLVPGTRYRITLYIRDSAKNYSIFHTSLMEEVQTLTAAPGPPSNVTLSQIPQNREIVVSWNPPNRKSGKITGFRIYFSPPFPPSVVSLNNGSLKMFTIKFSFEPGVNYSFWVTAVTGELESMNSFVSTVVFAKDGVMEPVQNLALQATTNSSVSLIWKEPIITSKLEDHNSNSASSGKFIDGYSVAFRVEYVAENYPWNITNCTDTKITVQDLPPGVIHIFKVWPYKGNFRGPEKKIEVMTEGDQLPVVNVVNKFVNGTNVTLNWNQPKDKRKAQWEYGVFIVNAAASKPVQIARTFGTSITLSGLDACVTYALEVRLIGPFSMGPSKGLNYATTKFNKKAAPINVTADISGHNKSLAIIKWNSACSIVDQDVGYKVHIQEENLGLIWDIIVKPNQLNTLTQNFHMHFGGIYNVSVQSLVQGSRASRVLKFSAPPLPIPSQVDAVPELNGSLYIRWKEVDWPKQLLGHNFSYMVHLGKQSLVNAVLYNVTKPLLVVPSMEIETTYYIAVQVVDQHNYTSQLSEIITTAYPAAATSLVISTNNVISVVIPILLVIFGLLGALIFYVVRHKRLQRSFMTFANSHYDTRSGSATFSTGQDDQLDEEDSPMIRGFSDDEPLVIA